MNEVRQSRALLERTLERRGVQFWPSGANFVLIRVGSSEAAATFVEQMRRFGILVRDRSNDPGCEGCVRITLGPKPHLEQLLTALCETLEKLAVAPGARS